VMLVGWSYGGTIVAGAADLAPERIGHLVYFDSDVPRDGDTSAPRSAHARRLELAQQYGDGWPVPPSATRLESALLRDLPADQQNWIRERFAAHPLNTWLQPIRLSGAADGIPPAMSAAWSTTTRPTRTRSVRTRGSGARPAGSTWR